MKRRDFLTRMGMAAGALAAGAVPGLSQALADGRGEGAAGAEDKFILSAPLTHSDWMLVSDEPWGAEGVQHMLDTCKQCGWSRIYWRCLDGGRALYGSRFVRPQGKWDKDNFWDPARTEDLTGITERHMGKMPAEQRLGLLRKLERYDYGTFDTLAEAVRYGHQIGLEVHAWISINEDDHSWGIESSFAKAHPESRWRKRDGTYYRSQQSFAFPQVMQYKLAIVREVIENYPVDGIFLDWIRTGDVRDDPQNDAEGVADHGYETPLVEGFKARYGVNPHDVSNRDPRWVRFRAQPQTEFMRKVRALVNAQRAGLPIAVMVANPWDYRGFFHWIDGNLRGLLLDVKTWAREGLMDAAVPAGYYTRGGNREMAQRALLSETMGKVNVWLYSWPGLDPTWIEEDVILAKRLGAKQILFWEAHELLQRKDLPALMRGWRKHAKQL